MVITAVVPDTASTNESVVAERYARRCVIATLAITFVVCVPLLFVDSAYDDDWAWVWVHYWQGAGAIQEYMWMIAHPGFGPVLNFFFWIGGAVPGRAAHIVSLFCHLCSGWLLWQIFRVGRNTAPVAAVIAIAYLTAPFVAGIRASFAHDTYDVFIVCYLLSIWLSGRSGMLALIVALVACAFGLSLETLMSLEAMRRWYLYQCGYRGKAYVVRATPYFLFAIATIVLRLTVLVPTGYTTGHNEIEPFSLIELLRQTRAHLAYYLKALGQLQYVPALVKTEALFVLALALAAGLVGFSFYRIRARTDRRDLVGIAIAGILLLGAGALPYIAAHRPPTRDRDRLRPQLNAI